MLVDCSDLSELVFVVCVFDGGSVVAKGRRGRGTTLVRAYKSKRVDVISAQHKNCKLISRKLINIHGKLKTDKLTNCQIIIQSLEQAHLEFDSTKRRTLFFGEKKMKN